VSRFAINGLRNPNFICPKQLLTPCVKTVTNIDMLYRLRCIIECVENYFVWRATESGGKIASYVRNILVAEVFLTCPKVVVTELLEIATEPAI
jgi:hypothetical protein